VADSFIVRRRPANDQVKADPEKSANNEIKLRFRVLCIETFALCSAEIDFQKQSACRVKTTTKRKQILVIFNQLLREE
jgi:hypothetical protein